jgi:hypothetical protein
MDCSAANEPSGEGALRLKPNPQPSGLNQWIVTADRRLRGRLAGRVMLAGREYLQLIAYLMER